VSESEPLFREEAYEYLLRGSGPGELLRASVAWTERAYWGLLALIAAGLAATLVVHTGDEPLLFVLVPMLKTLAERLHG
jgi:hypothetical protein